MHTKDFAHICSVIGMALGCVTLLSSVPGCAGKIIDDPDNAKQSVYVGPGGGNSGSGNGTNTGYGLTFGFSKDPNIGADLVHPTCHDASKSVERPWSGSCNPYSGDTSCESAQPILCVRMDQSPAPPNFRGSFYNGWVPGVLASTSPIVGERLTSLGAADAICKEELGEGYRMAEFHDGNGGWTFTGKRGAINEQLRHWVHINDQPGNCWDAR